jgi:hypothetical protein
MAGKVLLLWAIASTRFPTQLVLSLRPKLLAKYLFRLGRDAITDVAVNNRGRASWLIL